MPDETQDLKPVTAIVVSATGAGGVAPQTIETPEGQRDVVLKVVTPVVAIVAGALTTFLTVWLGLLTGALTTTVIPYHDFADLAAKCAGLSVAGTVISTAKDVLTVLTRLKEKFPLLGF